MNGLATIQCKTRKHCRLEIPVWWWFIPIFGWLNVLYTWASGFALEFSRCSASPDKSHPDNMKRAFLGMGLKKPDLEFAAISRELGPCGPTGTLFEAKK